MGAALLASALAAAPGGCSAPDDASAPRLLAAVHHRGGLCSSGTCSTDLTIYDDGRWKLHDETSGDGSGTLSDDQVQQIKSLVTEFTVPPTTSATSCPADYDGTQTIYTIGTEPEITIDACAIRIPPSDPLIETLDHLFQELSQN